MMKKIKSNTTAIPIWGFMAASFLLLVILGSITYLNYNREGELMKQHYLHEALTLSSTLESSARIGVADFQWGEEEVQKLLRESVKGPNIEYIIVVDGTGKVLTNTRGIPSGEVIKGFRIPTPDGSILTEVIEEPDGSDIFQLTKKCQAFLGVNQISGIGLPEQNDSGLSSSNHYILLGLNMAEFEEARREDVRRALISAGILLILGSGTFYFLLLMQNYASVSNTLKHMETYTQNVVESMPNGLISLDTQGYIETFNHNAAALLGLQAQNVRGKLITEVLPKCNLPQILNPQTDIMEEQVECHRNDGRIIPVSLTASRLKGEDGEVIGTVLILRDLRQIKALEKKVERSERLASLGRMAAGIAHEIRNPLSSIKGFAQYFRNKFHPQSPDWNYATLMAKEVDRLNRVIQELLNFSRSREVNIQTVELRPLVQHTIKLIESDVRDKNIRLNIRVDGGEPIYILADSDLLTQALLNLFINALEAMDEGGELSIIVDDRGNRVVINIQDTGSGIAPEQLPKIFDPFFTTKQGGTGLGLAITYRQIEQMQGEIEVNSKLGEGTTFKVILQKTEKES